MNLEPTRPNGLVGCKVPTDLVKVSVKEAMHMGFYYISTQSVMISDLVMTHGHVFLEDQYLKHQQFLCNIGLDLNTIMKTKYVNTDVKH